MQICEATSTSQVSERKKLEIKNSSLVQLNIFVTRQLVVKRWNNIRDQWIKWKNRDKNTKKSGAAASKLRKYVYHEQLNFLDQVPYHRSTDSSMDYEAESQQQTEEHQPGADQGTAPPDATKQTSHTSSARKRKRTLDEFEERILRTIEAGDKEDRHMQFFKGILPSLQKFNENQIVDFQMGVLQVIKNIQNTVCIPTQPQQLQMYASPYSQQNPFKYPLHPCSPLLSRISSQHQQTIQSSNKSTNIVSPPYQSPDSDDTQSTSIYINLSSPFSQNADFDF